MNFNNHFQAMERHVFGDFFHTIHCYCVEEQLLNYKFCSFNDNPGHCLDGLQRWRSKWSCRGFVKRVWL